MEIKTITCHDVYNYGASLQAFALQEYLRSLGHDVEIIDYLPDYLSHHYRFWYVPEYNRFHSLCKRSKLFHFLYSIRLAPITFRTWRRIKPFKNFKSTYLLCTRRYSSFDELRRDPPKAQLYIAGSDQIWNPLLPNGKDGAFFLDFGQKDVHRISYAASFAISEIPDADKRNMAQWLTRFDGISVREKTAVRLLDEIGFRGLQVSDPVFLLSAEEWLQRVGRKPLIEGDYLLVYNLFSGNDELVNTAKVVSAQFGLKIVAINDKNKFLLADRNVSNAGPIEFVNYIANSSYVICDSFHGTAFSVIFRKPFAVCYHKNNISRIADFLQDVGLQERLNTKEPLSTNIDWETAQRLLDEEIDISKNYLATQIANCQ